MTPQDFCYFLQGYLEISGTETLDARQTQIIKDHLDLVFNKATPIRDLDKIKEAVEKINIREEGIRYC